MQSPWTGNAGNFLQTLTTLIAFVLTEEFTEVQGKEQKRFSLQEPRALPEPELVHPVRVDPLGRFLSHQLSHRLRKRPRRQLQPEPEPVHYRLSLRGRLLHFNLTINQPLLAPGFLAERRYGGLKGAAISRAQINRCHFVGTVQAGSSGMAAISTCQGLKGVFRLSDEDYFIEPLEGQPWDEDRSQPHVIYKRHAPETKGLESHWLDELMERSKNKSPEENRVCGVSDSPKNLQYLERKREKWEKKKQRRRRIKQRSISKEKWVETLVVADSKMVEHHGSENIEAYVLTVMNMVAGLFRDASIGNSVNIVIVRLVLLEEDEEDLKITHHADNTLMNFCKWQKKINTKGDNHPIHHDVALLLTRKDICAGMNRPCETLGLSHVSGMCQPHRSCSINEDSGLPLAFTIAHEIGHNFGIQHDGTGNDCEPIGKRPFIMSPQLLYDTSPLTWSRCSREYITRFLDRGWGLCLDDVPSKEVIDLPSVAPGVLYDVNHQCRMQYGARSVFCDNMDSVCNTLWCTVGNTCHSKLDAAVDGTKCGENKWCFDGDCIPTDQRPDSTNGNWGAWGSWSSCSRTCSAGIQSAERHCNNPTPKYGGSYCLGERKRFRVCNIKACTSDLPTFRQIQCSQFDTLPYKGKLHKWIPVLSQINPCELHCRPIDGYFSEKMLDAVIDGTPCFEGNTSRDMCINGICKNVGCDYEIDSNALEDRCGVCHGNGSTCETVKKTFDKTEGLGYVDIGLIPEGAREIRIEEVAEAGNFLALRSDDPEKYFLNGGWIIQWNGDYKVAGTTFTYERTGNLENLTSPGPTKEPVWIQLLFQETNPGVRFEYTIRRDLDDENEIPPPEFFWRYGLWTECSATCGGGVQRQIVHCLEKIAGIVQEQYCELLTRPDDRQRSCHPEPCPARWWVGEWQACSSSCGEMGTMKRTALCIQSVGLDEQRALQPSDCQHLPRPETTSPCHREIPCPSDWSVGSWSECSVTCGEGLRRRSVLCLNNTNMTCSFEMKPAAKSQCQLKPCPLHRSGFTPHDWSGSGASSKELYNEVGFNLNFGPSRAVQEDNSNQILNLANPHPSDLNTPLPHPSEDNNINNHIVEDDFTVHSSQDENSAKTNVFVDDFYYDYNFINFHEDLDYDPEDRLEKEEWTGEDIKHDEEHLEINNISNNVWEKIPDESHDRTIDDTGSDGLENVVSTPTTNQKPDSQEEIETPHNPIVNSTSGANAADIELSELPTEYLRVTDGSPITVYDTNNEDDEEELYQEDELLPIQNTTKHSVKEIASPGFPSTDDERSIDHTIRTHSPHYHSPPSITMTTSSTNNNVNTPSAFKSWQQHYPEEKQNITDHNLSHRVQSTTEQGGPFDIKVAGYTHPADSREQGKGQESKGHMDDMKQNPLEGERRVEKDEQEIVNKKAHFPSSTLGNSHYLGDVVHVDDSPYPQHETHDQDIDVINKNLNSWESLGTFNSITGMSTTTPSFFIDPNDVPVLEMLHWSVHQKQTEANSPGRHHVGSSSELPGNIIQPGDFEYDNTRANVQSPSHSVATQTPPLLAPVLATSSPPVFSEATGVSTTPVAFTDQPNLDRPLQTQSTSDRTQSHNFLPIEVTHSGHSFIHAVTPQSRLSTGSSLTPASLHQQGTRLGKTPSSRSVAVSSTRTTTSSGKGISRPNLSAATSPKPTSALSTSLILTKETQQSATSLPVIIPQASISVPPGIISTTVHSKVNAKGAPLVDVTRLNSENRMDEGAVKIGEIDRGDAEFDFSNGSLPATVSNWPLAVPEMHLPTVSNRKPLLKNTTEVHAASTVSLMETAANRISGVNTESSAYWVVGNWSHICERDRLTFAFCQTLKLLGRCYLQTVQAQCCQTCRSHGVRDRGNERVSRR
ncbi:A disintegrin and metalloproteinase with thrombospondin motifs 7-like [Rhincodon typus]|uniref:A disintegrin and metalloproteinase with thrombospondin motifs 7-like n=1 Tax=Rhincodon typus TaxID=259920 RepID=UPI00202EB70E|nr:A disintegrin and metalloproteinase with thrombospondin motifs 7-like [Rhincodon typus]